MNLLLSGAMDLWQNFYNKYVINVDDRTRYKIGFVSLMIAIGLFILCTKGHNKAAMVNSWFLFWLSLIVFGISLLYLCVL